MVHLTTAASSFHARVVAARLGADGIVTELHGGVDGPYAALGSIDVLVSVDDFETARDLLLADRVEAERGAIGPVAAVGDDDGDDDRSRGAGRAAAPVLGAGRAALLRWALVAAVLFLACCTLLGRAL